MVGSRYVGQGFAVPPAAAERLKQGRGIGIARSLRLHKADAQRSYQQARIGLVQAQAARYADSAALFQALGGGWWNREPPADISGTHHD